MHDCVSWWPICLQSADVCLFSRLELSAKFWQDFLKLIFMYGSCCGCLTAFTIIMYADHALISLLSLLVAPAHDWARPLVNTTRQREGKKQTGQCLQVNHTSHSKQNEIRPDGLQKIYPRPHRVPSPISSNASVPCFWGSRKSCLIGKIFREAAVWYWVRILHKKKK